MKSRKKLICLAMAAALVTGAAFTGCTVTDNEADVKRTVAVVNISKADAFKDEFAGYESVITDKVFIKRDMLTAYYNGYYQYVQNGSSYAEVFDTIKDGLVSNAVTTQYATVYLLKSAVEDTEKDVTLEGYNACETEAKKYEYILDAYDDSAVARAEYSISVTLNSVLDSSEKAYLKDEEEEDEYKGSGTRATPSGIDATVEEYIPEDYFIYTGYEGYLLPEGYEDKELKEGDYEPLYGTTKATRRKAYASFITSLKNNYLLTEADTQTTDIWELSYVQESYVSQLQSEVISVFQDKIKEDQEENIIKTDEGGVYTYVKEQYDSLLEVQSKDYDNKSTFETAFGNMSDSSFILYSPKTTNDTEAVHGVHGKFGYVYNILLPFSSYQTTQLAVLQSYRDSDIYTESEYFIERNKLLKNIVTTDQRAAWFNGTTDYSFKASETELEYYGKDKGRYYLFFENNMTDTEHKQYEALEKYYGKYSYNGTVKKNKNGSYTLIANKLSIDGMLQEFKAYLDYVLGGDRTSYTVEEDYYTYDADEYTIGDTKEVNYEKLVYATGSVDFTDGRENMFVTDSARYKAMAAVNELQYAYTTDTGVLSQYIGYTVSAYDTSYIKEFEYAAQEAVRKGAGNFSVCAGDYGWHLIYVTETFDFEGGEVYSVEFSKERVEKEGTFENRFYNWMKDSHLAQEVTLKTNAVLKEYNTDKAVTVYSDVYNDLSELN